jgi:hypothetical protein
LVQLALMLVGGGRSVADAAAVRDQRALFGDVASAPTIWRAVDGIDHHTLNGLRAARAEARTRAWAAGRSAGRAAGAGRGRLRHRRPLGEQGAGGVALQGRLQVHPMFCFADDGQALAGILRRGNATAKSGGHRTCDPLTQLSIRSWCEPIPPAPSTRSSPASPNASARCCLRPRSATRWTRRSWCCGTVTGTPPTGSTPPPDIAVARSRSRRDTGRLARRHPGHRAPGTPSSRRPATPLGPQRLAPPGHPALRI